MSPPSTSLRLSRKKYVDARHKAGRISRRPTRLFVSHPKDRETQDQQNQEDHDEDIKQEPGYIRRCRRYVGEAEEAGDQRYQKEDQRPFQNCHWPLLYPQPPERGPSKTRILLW